MSYEFEGLNFSLSYVVFVDEGVCPVVELVDDCSAAREMGLHLDEDALELCNRHQLCYTCVSMWWNTTTENLPHHHEFILCFIIVFSSVRGQVEDRWYRILGGVSSNKPEMCLD